MKHFTAISFFFINLCAEVIQMEIRKNLKQKYHTNTEEAKVVENNLCKTNHNIKTIYIIL